MSQGPGSTPEISSKANPQSKFPFDFLLNPFHNQVGSEKPFGKSKQPTLKIPSASHVHVGHEEQVDDMAPKGKTVLSQEPIGDCDELHASSPLIHKEKVTRHHHPYASKARTVYASSSRKKILDDEDENMSPTQSKTNDEPRRDYFMVHEQGTQSNSEFTHPQISLSQSMLNQSKMRQQRNQACKAHNVAKRASQKEKQR
ncbi:hypothetical protein O181_041642 [Austropuccinia psidii MF-1]|uniref:Uncharacterized protein n=1 Tax=Austropuccinia psidii MF-1 TaxID=1389203 RepID=A0A9Q3HF17_9BASI|nr:hypothetical protein [Austropuccinia psidii MF-1]